MRLRPASMPSDADSSGTARHQLRNGPLVGHVPHVWVPPPWHDDLLPLDAGTRRHVEKVLRRGDGAAVSYTDGAGVVGSGVVRNGSIVRNAERQVAPPPEIVLAVAPPHQADRARYLVEKLGKEWQQAS